MSTERTDHAAEARRITAAIAEAVEPLRDRDDIPVEIMNALNGNGIRDLLAAQVHATLALVEQQRINNLIAYGREMRRDLALMDEQDELMAWARDGGGVAGYLSKSDRAALGLEATE